VLANGQFILKYYKRTFDQFQAGASAAAFKTKDKGSTFTYRGITFGIEICLDHSTSYKTLKTAVGATKKVDVHLLVSEGMGPTRASVAAKVGGLVINCDMSGRAAGNGVRPVTAGTGGTVNIDAGVRGRVAVHGTQALGNGAHVVLYSGTV
jgi:hypothetical protein